MRLGLGAAPAPDRFPLSCDGYVHVPMCMYAKSDCVEIGSEKAYNMPLRVIAK